MGTAPQPLSTTIWDSAQQTLWVRWRQCSDAVYL
eukprot:COSAG01_NODE_33652_length_560_cov_2831.960954_3_plen_33_part_01